MEQNNKDIMTEQWQRWNPPYITIEEQYFIDHVSLKAETVCITVSNAADLTHLIQFTFTAITYRYTNESYRLATISDINHVQGVIYADWTFFKVINSSYLTALHASQDSHIHYAFITSDAIVDVISTNEPLVACTIRNDRE